MTEKQREHYTGVVEFLSAAFGDTLEIALFEVTKERKTSLCAKSKNHKKNYGDSLDKNFMEWIRNHEKDEKYITKLPMKEKDGTLSRVSFYFVTDEEGRLSGVLTLKKNISSMVIAANFLNDTLKALTGGPERNLEAEITKKKDPKQENSLLQYSSYLIEDYLASLNTPVYAMSIEDRVKVVEALYKKGVFQLKGNISVVAKKLDISEKTVYRYLKDIEES